MAGYNCEVIEAGLDWDGKGIVRLREVSGAFAFWGVPHPEFKKEVLSVALLALSTNRRVNVGVPDSPSPPADFTQITRFSVERG